MKKKRPTRLTHDARRTQLLELAWVIIREEGTDALTLARLADRAGVTKPITYRHFKTRAGLLAELYRDCDGQLTGAIDDAVRVKARSLRDVSDIVSAAYVDCVIDTGEVGDAVLHALAAYDQSKDLRESSRRTYLGAFQKAFGRFVAVPQSALPLYSGILGAIETLAQDAASQRITRKHAIEMLSDMIVSVLSKYVRR